MVSASLDDDQLRESLDAIVDRVDSTQRDLGTESFPFVADLETGEWETTDAGNWCGGHWIGLLWIASSASMTSTRRCCVKPRSSYSTGCELIRRQNY